MVVFDLPEVQLLQLLQAAVLEHFLLRLGANVASLLHVLLQLHLDFALEDKFSGLRFVKHLLLSLLALADCVVLLFQDDFNFGF